MEGGGLGMDSTADKGAGRLNLKHHFSCVESCCIHDVVFEKDLSCRDIDVCILSSSLPGIDAPGAFATDIHRGERSNALPNAPNDPTGPSAPVVVQPLCDDDDDDDVDDDDVIYKRNDESPWGSRVV